MSDITIAEPAEQIELFVGCLYLPRDIVEARLIHGPARSSWHYAEDLAAEAAKFQSQNDGGWNVFFGVNPREKRGERGDSAVKLARAVFVDFDDTHNIAARAKWDALGLPEPTIAINSGHGSHLYIRLHEPMTDMAAWRELQGDLAVALGGDVKVRNPERIMRAPGYLNLKHEPFVLCDVKSVNVMSTIGLSDVRALVPQRPKEAPRHPCPQRSTTDKNAGEVAKRCRAYLSKLPDAISGSGGHGATFHAACVILRFGLDGADARDMLDWFNEHKCEPKWPERELKHKMEDAYKAASGDLGSLVTAERPVPANGRHHIALGNSLRPAEPHSAPLPAPHVLPDDAPRTLAHAFIAQHFHSGRHFRGDFYLWHDSSYRRVETEVMRADLASFLAVQRIVRKTGECAYVPNTRRINDVADALATVTQVRVDGMPAWLDDRDGPKAGNLIAFQNGLLDVAAYAKREVRLLAPTPDWFSTTVLPFQFDESASEPQAWFNFLHDLWGDDHDAIALLQDWMGYALTADTRHQKIFLLTGPPRSGKGTIARILTKILGTENVAGPTLAGLGTNFGLSALLAKQLAIVSDARLSGRTDQAIIVERLLSISGEDSLTIDRKFRDPVTLTLPTRLMLVSNELPKLADASGALAERFLVLVLKRSFLGNEDTDLTGKLAAELPGILNWSLKGLRRLHERGRFVEARSGVEALEELRDLVSPIRAFIRDRCEVAPGRCVAATALYDCWVAWCGEQGRDQPGTVQSFGRDLRAALSTIHSSRPSDASGARIRTYEGIGTRQ